MSVMLYPCMLCVALLMCLFVLSVACLTVFVNWLVWVCGCYKPDNYCNNAWFHV